jgi:hypothetical protein
MTRRPPGSGRDGEGVPDLGFADSPQATRCRPSGSETRTKSKAGGPPRPYPCGAPDPAMSPPRWSHRTLLV